MPEHAVITRPSYKNCGNRSLLLHKAGMRGRLPGRGEQWWLVGKPVPDGVCAVNEIAPQIVGQIERQFGNMLWIPQTRAEHIVYPLRIHLSRTN